MSLYLGSPISNRVKRVSDSNSTKKRKGTINLEERKSFDQVFFRFKGKKLKLCMIRHWSVTSKPYIIAEEDVKLSSNLKSL